MRGVFDVKPMAVVLVALVVALFVAVVVAAPAGAQPVTPGLANADEQAAMTRALMRDFGISEQRAAANVAIQAKVPNLVADLRDAVGEDGYAGVWFDNEAGRYEVGVTSEQAAAAARRLLADLGIGDDSRVSVVRYSWSELTVEKERWVPRLEQLGPGSFRMAVDPRANRLAIDLASTVAPARVSELRAATARAADRVSLRPNARSTFALQQSACVWPNCDVPLRGGVEIYNATSTCTAGFIAWSYSDGLPYLVTAGHCVEGDASWWTASNSAGSAITVGPRHSWYNDVRGDAAIIALNYGSWPSFYRGIAAWELTGEYEIRGGSFSSPGIAICRYGATTRRQCGNVIASDSTYFGQNHMGEATACASPGDSGGPYTTMNRAIGIASSVYVGGACNQTPGPSIFSEAMFIDAQLNVYF